MKMEAVPKEHLLNQYESTQVDGEFTFSFANILGFSVTTEEGHQVGRVTDIIIDTTKSEVLQLQVVLLPKQRDNKIVAIPWSELRFDEESNCLQLTDSLMKNSILSRRRVEDLDGGLYDNYRAIRFGNPWC